MRSDILLLLDINVKFGTSIYKIVTWMKSLLFDRNCRQRLYCWQHTVRHVMNTDWFQHHAFDMYRISVFAFVLFREIAWSMLSLENSERRQKNLPLNQGRGSLWKNKPLSSINMMMYIWILLFIETSYVNVHFISSFIKYPTFVYPSANLNCQNYWPPSFQSGSVSQRIMSSLHCEYARDECRC